MPVKEAEHDRTAYGILSFFAKELQRFNEGQPRHRGAPLGLNGEAQVDSHFPGAKRRRTNDDTASERSGRSNASAWFAVERHQEAILRAYFTHVHAWIPMVHEGRLRRRLADHSGSQALRVILRAMVLVATRFVDSQDVMADLIGSEEDELEARDWVVCNATRELSVENIQALIMISFNDVSRLMLRNPPWC